MSGENKLQACDIFFTQSDSVMGKAIRFFTRKIGESRTKVNHVGLVVEGGTTKDSTIVEALAKVRRHTLWQGYGTDYTKVAVYRPKNLTADDKRIIIEKAESYVGKKYGVIKIVTHWLDWMLMGAFVFRRLTRVDRYPICSFLVAKSYAEAGKFFGCSPGKASPDDIWDFITTSSEKYECIYPLDLMENW